MKFCILYGYENGIRLRWETLRGASLRVEKLRSRPYKIFRRATICLKTLMTIAYFLKIIVRVFFQCLTSQGPIFGGCALCSFSLPKWRHSKANRPENLLKVQETWRPAVAYFNVNFHWNFNVNFNVKTARNQADHNLEANFGGFLFFEDF